MLFFLGELLSHKNMLLLVHGFDIMLLFFSSSCTAMSSTAETSADFEAAHEE